MHKVSLQYGRTIGTKPTLSNNISQEGLPRGFLTGGSRETQNARSLSLARSRLENNLNKSRRIRMNIGGHVFRS